MFLLCQKATFYLKVVISQAPIVPAAIATAMFESGILSRMDRDLPCLISRRDPCLHEQRVYRASRRFRKGSLACACSSAQKREKSLSSLCCLFLYPIHMPPFL